MEVLDPWLVEGTLYVPVEGGEPFPLIAEEDLPCSAPTQ